MGLLEHQVGEKMGESRDGNLYLKPAGVELEHGLQRGVELLSAREVTLWFRRCLMANGLERRRSGALKGTTPVHGAPGPWRGREGGGSSRLGDLGGRQRVSVVVPPFGREASVAR
jgi:hypothetical protein